MTFTFLSADVGKTIDQVLTTHLYTVNYRLIKLTFVANFGLIRYIAVVVVVFSAVSMVSSFEADDNTHSSVRVGEILRNTKQTTTVCFVQLLRHIDAVRSRMKADQGISFSTAALNPQREKKQWGSYLVVSTHTLGPVNLRRGRGRVQ